MSQKLGKLMCLDGFEGAGKTTRAQVLTETLHADYDREAEVMREPGGDEFSEQLRQILKYGAFELTPWAEIFAFSAARTNMLQRQVVPKLEAGIDVVLDRTYISTMAYQGYGNDLGAVEMEFLRQVCQMAIAPAPPAVIVVLDVSFEVSMRRIGSRGEQTDRFEGRPREYLKRVIHGYLAEADLGKHPVVNTDKSEAAVDAAILQQVLPILD